MKKYALIIVAGFAFLSTNAQKLRKKDRSIKSGIERHISYLADDKLQGRRAGSEGEKMAREYISLQFKIIGLKPMGTDGTYFQAFPISDGKEITPVNHLIINGHDLKLNTEYFPFPYSPFASRETFVSIALREKEVPWFYDLVQLEEENKNNPHFDIMEAIRTTANEYAKKGASAFILYSSKENGEIRFNPKDRSSTSIPVFFVHKKIADQYFADETQTLDIKYKTEFVEKNRTANNVIGYIDNNAAQTVVIGAHYDHLGLGEDGNSMLRGGPLAIHNGADDNASGTAAVIEMARLLKNSKIKDVNFLFIAFSGEELGLLGSKYFTENPTIDLAKVNYMINLDMIGRLNPETKTITVGGYGTSPSWSAITSKVKNKYFDIKIDSAGSGPSDHTSFYRKNIPVLFFFTGLHTDYHKPSDDFNKIDYTGETFIIKYIFETIEESRNYGKLAFLKTREAQTSTSARFTVSMGIMPDYGFSGAGVRVDGVTEGRAAEKAGIKTGDIITRLGDSDVSSVEAYMQALSKFKKGDKTTVSYKRGSQVISGNIEF